MKHIFVARDFILKRKKY